MRHRFRVVGRFDHASRVQVATVTVDRAAGTFEVRPLRRRRLPFVITLDKVAEMVVQRIIKAEVFARRLEKAQRRKGRR